MPDIARDPAILRRKRLRQSALGIVRLSGPGAWEIVLGLFERRLRRITPRHACLRRLRLTADAPAVEAVVTFWRAARVVSGALTNADVALPVKVSANKRYFVDQNDKPVFWLGTTQWQLFRGYRLEDAKTILERSAKHGFAFVQVMLMGVGDGTKANVYGQKPWLNDNPLTPNEGYFKNVDAVLRIAGVRSSISQRRSTVAPCRSMISRGSSACRT